MRENLIQAIETFRNLAYLTQHLKGEKKEYIQKLQKDAELISDNNLQNVLEDIQAQIETAKELVGCKLSDDDINLAVKRLTSIGDGYPCLSKIHIDQWFDNYAYVFPRWPHIPGHALVQFDSNIDGESPGKLFLAEQMLCSDVRLLWDHITRLAGDGLHWKQRDDALQQHLSSYMRLAAAAIYHFLEAYLNGIAYNCFQDFHDSMDLKDHDTLAEWNSSKRQTRYTSFDFKLKKYPGICGKYMERKVNLASDKDVKYLLGEGKLLRDALTHPGPFVNVQSANPTKMQMIGGITPEQIQKLLFAAVGYVRKVEMALGRDVSLSMPWLKIDLHNDREEHDAEAGSA